MSKTVNPSIQTRLNALHERIQQACIDSGRDRQSVTLIGVSKTKPARNVAEAALETVRQAAPYQPFNVAMRKRYDQLSFTRTWQFSRRGASIN